MTRSATPVSTHLVTPVLVYGLGRSGLAVTRLLRRQGSAVEVYDRAGEDAAMRTAVAEGAVRTTTPRSTRATTCIAAPGVPIDIPDLVALRERGVEVIGEVDWVTRTVPGRYVGITGTAGKGSTTRWLTDTLQAAGVRAVAGGNIDPALAAVAEAGATHVVEMSSFQLERSFRFHPTVAVVLNLGEDHIDRHGSVRAYHEAKRRLLRNLTAADTLVFNADDPVAAAWAQASPARARGFSLLPDPQAAAHLDAKGTALLLDGERLLDVAELRVPGSHQVANGLAVALAAQALGLDRDVIAVGLRSFEGLPGRYAEVGRSGGLRFLEDSIATRPLSVAAALRATPRPLAWIAGGQGKGAALDALVPLVAERVDVMVCIGEAGPAFASTFGAATEVVRCEALGGRQALRDAIDAAVEHLDARHAGMGNVLLAPLAASFDQFSDYAERGRVFRELVQDTIARRGEAVRGEAAPRQGAGQGEGAERLGEGATWTRCS